MISLIKTLKAFLDKSGMREKFLKHIFLQILNKKTLKINLEYKEYGIRAGPERENICSIHYTVF